MATLVLQTAGQALGGAVAGPIGAAIGQAAGGIAGSIVDQALFGPPPRRVEGPRLNDLHVTGSTEGAPVPVMWGRARMAGQLIWATPFEEQITHRSQGGGKGSLSRPTANFTEYAYFANVAIALCEGPIDRIGRIWADGKEINPASLVWRLYQGSEDQQPDSLIEAIEGTGNAPAYRGVAYLVFEHMPLAQFGNRLPQLSFEVFRSLDGVEHAVKAINIIPGSTEFGYDTLKVRREDGFGGTLTENVHTFQDKADFLVSLDQLQATCPNLQSASLVVAWFGDDLRCGSCTVEPRIDNADKHTEPVSWKVAGIERSQAQLVSLVDNRAAFGGSPDDGSVRRAIAELKQRGLEVCFYPFVLMDIAAGNLLPDPHSAAASQPAYPWRGMITCSPAIGQPGTADGTALARAQVDAFFGTAQATDFSIAGDEVIYAGPSEWSYRRMILHYAHLCAAAGGVESFLVGTELVQLNRIRDDTGAFVAVGHLRQLAADVAAVLPDAKISYAADWSEYSGYRPDDGSGDVWFHLDPLWADPAVHFIAIDNYLPLSDWRDGRSHADFQAGWHRLQDAGYLQANIEAGEYFDWYYASDADRLSQLRQPIIDLAHNEHWVFRTKDIHGWWANAHHNRPGGNRQPLPTAWQPMSKPVRFTEVGVPAIDKGTNQPNVFYDPKSASSALPYFSNGNRDDLLQRTALGALLSYWDEPANNPVSPVYGGAMIDTARTAIWAWDARPYPAFPFLTDVWSDGENHEFGHWLNGRLGALELPALVADIMRYFGAGVHDVSALDGVVEGYVLDRPMSARAALEPLSSVFLMDVIERGHAFVFSRRNGDHGLSIAAEDLALARDGDEAYELRRAQETELPAALALRFADASIDYRPAVVDARQIGTSSRSQSVVEFPGVLNFGEAHARVTTLLRSAWSSREAATFSLPPSRLAVEPGDIIRLTSGGHDRDWRVTEVRDQLARHVTAVLRDPEAGHAPAGRTRTASLDQPAPAGRVIAAVLDLPLVTGNEDPYAPWVAAAARPWPGQVAVHRLQGEASFTTDTVLTSAAVLGTTLDELPPLDRPCWDRGSRIRVRLSTGALESAADVDVLAGANTAVVGNVPGERELIQYRHAVLVAPLTWEISGLLRAQAGTDAETAAGAPAGSAFVLLDNSVRQLPPSAGNIGRQFDLRVGAASLDAADPLLQDISLVFSGRGLRPYSPVHARARMVGGSIEVSWIRRTRIGGDSWDVLEVPLGEDVELYQVDIVADGEVVRTFETASPLLTYPGAELMADFGTSLPPDLHFRIHQVSPVYGRGSATTVTFT